MSNTSITIVDIQTEKTIANHIVSNNNLVYISSDTYEKLPNIYVNNIDINKLIINYLTHKKKDRERKQLKRDLKLFNAPRSDVKFK